MRPVPASAPAPVWPFGPSLLLALLLGGLLRLVVGLEPVWWLAWLVPAGLLVLAARTGARPARGLLLLAALMGYGGHFAYFRQLMPAPVAAGIVLLLSLQWTAAALTFRRLVRRYPGAWWPVLSYPVVWVALDTLAAALLPDGNWGSLAYSQAEVLPLLQITSVLGVAGLLFLLTLTPAVLALGLLRGRAAPPWSAYALAAGLLLAALGYGQWRLARPPAGPLVRFGLAAIDDRLPAEAPPAARQRLLAAYDAHLSALRAQGAEVVVLPEAITQLPAARAGDWQQALGALAARHGVWLMVGVVEQAPAGRRNLAWLFAPAGTPATTYQKHFLAPPERDCLPGQAYATLRIGGQVYGLAICKDLHFARLGRAYGQRRAAVLLVPAWDFQTDAWLAARMSAVRGVENGYVVVRAARAGRLTVSDACGRVLGEADSAPLPGRALLVAAPVGPARPTLYTRLGNWLGWLCVAVWGAGRGRGWLRRRRSADRTGRELLRPA